MPSLNPAEFCLDYGIHFSLWFRLRRPAPDLRPAQALRPAEGDWIHCARRPSMLGATTFRFLSVTRVATATADWNRADWRKLWLYNLHYFDDLNADDASVRVAWRRALVSRWIAENPPAAGSGWEPYPLSLRLVNWVKWLAAGNAPAAGMVDSLAVQARWLTAYFGRW